MVAEWVRTLAVWCDPWLWPKYILGLWLAKHTGWSVYTCKAINNYIINQLYSCQNNKSIYTLNLFQLYVLSIPLLLYLYTFSDPSKE